jgi:uncharacterized SAM-binding protein YcdF (DUF218 family)
VAQRRFGFFFKFLVVILVAAAAAYASRHLWLPVFGYALIHDDGPVKADIAVVLAGDANGNRIRKAAELIKAGYAPLALISGPGGTYGFNEAELAIPFIVKQGYPASWFVGFPIDAHSTKEEAALILKELQRRNVKSFLLVTSDFHTGRSRRIYLGLEKVLGYEPRINTVAAPDEYFHADRWWSNRESEKTVFMEWSKTISTALGN